MVGVVEGDDAVLAGVVPGHLDGVLDRFGAGVEQGAPAWGWSPGVASLSFSQTATYSSYGLTMKQVWVKSAICFDTASMIRRLPLPTVVTAMPDPKSISWLPSASTRMPP